MDMKILIGDILQSKAQTLINTVNCVGVMGKGIALEFKKRFPDMYKDYLSRCERHEVKPGIPYLYKTLFPPQIINFPTKDHWKSISRIEDIEHGLRDLLDNYKAWGVTSLAVPPLGCGNGQLEWRTVGPLIYRYVKQIDIPVEMYAPYGTSPKELSIQFLENGMENHTGKIFKTDAPSFNPAWIALVEIVHRIEQHPYHWPVGRTIFQKIAYIATSEGLPTGLQYQRSSFGPFSKDLKGVETRLINANLLQEEQLGRMFMVKPGPNFIRVRHKYESTLARWSEIIDKTSDLFMRVNTNQAEVIATVLFAANELAQRRKESFTEKDILQAVMNWKQRRRPPLESNTVASTIRNLGMLRWLKAKVDPDLPVPDEEAIAV